MIILPHSAVIIAIIINLIEAQQAPTIESSSLVTTKNVKNSKISSPFSYVDYQLRDSSMPIFHLPYEKLANPLSSFLSWISSSYKSDQNGRTYDLLYDQQSDTSSSSSNAEKRLDFFPSFQFSKLSKISNSMARAYTNVPQSSGYTMPKSPQFDVIFPRHLPKEKRGISAITMKLIRKYAPNPKIHFFNSYFPQPYPVPVPFMVKDNLVYTTNGAIASQAYINNGEYGRSMGNSKASIYPDKQFKSYKQNVNLATGKNIAYSKGSQESISKPVIPAGQIGYSKSISLQNVNYNKPTGSSYRVIAGKGNKDLKANWKSSQSGRPYTGKAQYSAIDTSADPMSPSASMYSSKTYQFTPSKNLIKISELSK